MVDGAGPDSRRGRHVYEINTCLWNFGWPLGLVGKAKADSTQFTCFIDEFNKLA